MDNTSKNNKNRAVKIVSLHDVYGLSFSRISVVVGISRQRCHQIYKKYKLNLHMKSPIIKPGNRKISDYQNYTDNGIVRSFNMPQDTKPPVERLQEDLEFVKKSRIIRNYK